MNAGVIRVMLIEVLLLIVHTIKPVDGDFVLTVNFMEYSNPTGLCAECETELKDVTDASQLTPVCCDESPFRSDNCDNTGKARCDTRFRWTIRPFGALLETRPVSVPGADNPPYYFTDCGLSPTTCPFNETSIKFSPGSGGFLGVAENPLPVASTLPWTGKVQFFIEAVDSGLPNIIDSLLIDLSNLQLGADFTEEMTFTGYHNISHMTMSFKVACQNGSCGRDCIATRLNNPRILLCDPKGDVLCNDMYDPSTNCESCLYNLDFSTDCSTCLDPEFDPDTNCSACLPGYDLSTDCSTCLFGFDINRDCLVCLPGRNISTNCTTCEPGYIGEDCVLAFPNEQVDIALVGGIAGGVGGSLLLLIVVLLVVVGVLVCQRWKSVHKKYNVSASAVTPESGIYAECNPILIRQEVLGISPPLQPSSMEGQPVYDEANLPPPVPKPVAYEEIPASMNASGESGSSVYDKTFHSHSLSSSYTPSADTYSRLGEVEHPYAILEDSGTSSHTESYSEQSHPARAVAKEKISEHAGDYSLGGHTAEDVTTYDVSSHAPLQTQPHALPPHEAALYDTANFPSEPSRQNDYTETADFTGP